jgi:hypothetical protein
MNARCYTFAFILLTLSWSLCGCVANRAYRRGEQVHPVQLPLSVDGTLPSEADCADSPATPLNAQPPHYYLAHIEFDDMGELWSIGDLHGVEKARRSQIENAIRIIRNAQTLANKNDDKRELVVITFVHGWHNPPRYDEEHKNLGSFKSMMQTLSCDYTIKLNKRPVLVGIFLSWRGQSLGGDFAFTYWNRRDAATRAGGPSMTEVVTRLMFETKGVPLAPTPDSDCEPLPVNGKELAHFAIIAHSFGARALEHALTQPILAMVLERQTQARECAKERAERHPEKPGLETLTALAPADLIVFLNAANDAFEAKETIEALKRSQIKIKRRKAAPSGAELLEPSAPLMISITSDGDWATEKIMPVAQWFSSSALSFRRYDDQEQCESEGQLCDHNQSYYYRHSEASIKEMRSHLVIPFGNAASCKINGVDGWPFFRVVGKNECFCIDRSGENPKTTDECGLDETHRRKLFGLDTGWNGTPFYVVGVPKQLIRDHNDIFQDGTVELTAISTHYEILLSSSGPATMSFPIASTP